MNIIKGDIIHCLVGSFSSTARYCVVLNVSALELELLPITSKIRAGEECVCLDCNTFCKKIKLTK